MNIFWKHFIDLMLPYCCEWIHSLEAKGAITACTLLLFFCSNLKKGGDLLLKNLQMTLSF
jgi:hypothetical protein